MKILFLTAITAISLPLVAQKSKENPNSLAASTVSGLSFRLVGPAKTSGRIADIAVHPEDPHTWYVAAACGGVWKTNNHGTTFAPIFDQYGSYSIGCVTLAPSNPNTIWVGTGENNNQRSVSYGDGVYKSLDGGKSFKNMGLPKSEHIGKIIVHPTDENTIWVAAYGPLWSEGGERGVYKSTDGGTTWKRTLDISKHTGIAEIQIDPSNPMILYASAHQRRRHEWTYIGGGPESSLYKSTDGGETWREIVEGLPKGEMGRIGISVSPADPNYIYAIAEGRGDKGGFFRSTNKGESWEKMSSYTTSGNYYQEIVCDVSNRDKVFSMTTWLHHTEDGGKSFKATGEDRKHVDNHCIWINPKNSDHWIVGCDGGLYETFTHAKEWRYYDNMPIIQFYKVATDNAQPFYNIYGGTQDNNSMGGPSQTNTSSGGLNSDWFITNGGDGFESAIDPTNPNIVYAQAQYGWLVRYDKSSGETTPIQPMPGKGEAGYRWNWDAPLLISPHDPKTIYFCANKVFKSTNRGDDWTSVSSDLSRQLDRNKLPVMEQVWAIDMVEKNKSTTIYGNIVAFDESPKKKGLLYAGTDDGLIQISENDGSTWTKVSTFPGVPDQTRVNMICASAHDENVVFAVFNNHRSGDFKPYVLKSTDKGKTWKSISGDLPERGSAYVIRQDHVQANLLFAGTDFAAYFSNDGGMHWVKLAGLPTVGVFDLDIQQRETDLVAATFGRGFYVLDDYSALRNLDAKTLEESAKLFSTPDALHYIPSTPLGLSGTGSQGHNLWNAPNPAFGATFTLYLKETEKLLKDERREKERELEKAKTAVAYPDFERLKTEEAEEKAELIWIIRDAAGNEVKRMKSSPQKGISRQSWDLRMATTSPIQLQKKEAERYSSPDVGLLAEPGTYTVEVLLLKNGVSSQLIEKNSFEVVSLKNQTLPTSSSEELLAFRKEVAEVHRQVEGASKLMGESGDLLKYIKEALQNYPGTDLSLLTEVKSIENGLRDCQLLLWGDWYRTNNEFEAAPSISGRIGMVYYQVFENRSAITKTQRTQMALAEEEFAVFRTSLNALVERIGVLEKTLEAAKIPYFPNRDANWKEH